MSGGNGMRTGTLANTPLANTPLADTTSPDVALGLLRAEMEALAVMMPGLWPARHSPAATGRTEGSAGPYRSPHSGADVDNRPV